MEDLMQDQETVIQQLRLLLAAKEEEVHALKGQAVSDPDAERSDSIADGLLKEIEEKRGEVATLKARLKESEAKSKEKLARLSAALDEKEELIASLKAGPAQAAAGDADTVRKIAELEEGLKEKETLLAEAREALARLEARAAAEGGAGAGDTGAETPPREIERLGEELGESSSARADFERAAGERDDARAEAAALAGELASARLQFEEAERAHAACVAEFQQRIDQLQRGLDEAIAGKDGSSAGAETVSVPQRIRTLEAELEERDLAYRTTQTKLHRVTQNQQILRGLCAGLCVFLIFIISMKARQSASPKPVEARAEVLAEVRETMPLADLAKGLASRDSTFLTVPEARPAGPDAASVAQVPAPAPAQVADAVTAGFAQPEAEAEAPQSIAQAPAEPGLPVDVQFVEASTLALGPAPASVVSGTGRSPRALGAVARGSGDRVSYTVKKGESLWTICQRELGNGREMHRVARENKIANPNTVKVGDVLYLTRR